MAPRLFMIKVLNMKLKTVEGLYPMSHETAAFLGHNSQGSCSDLVQKILIHQRISNPSKSPSIPSPVQLSLQADIALCISLGCKINLASRLQLVGRSHLL